MDSKSSRVFIDDVTEESLQEKIARGLEFIRYENILDKESVVFVKPNLTYFDHKPGVTTTPLMSRAVIEALSPLVKKVYVGESDGGNYAFSADVSLRNHGIESVARKLPNVEVVNLSKLPRRRVKERVLGKEVWVDLPVLLLDNIDCLVSVPVLKTHAMTHGTFSIKNLWGCYSDPMRLLYHKNLDYKLALISRATKNRIQIVDGFWALDGHGPMEGTPKRVNKILVGNDPVAVDVSAAYIMGLDVKKITHLGVAEKYGLGCADRAAITYNRDIAGDRLSRFKPYKIRLDYLNGLLFKSELLARIVLHSPCTPVIYTLLNATRGKEKRTYWSSRNKKAGTFEKAE